MTPLEQVLRYHEETKHHFMRYARSLGYLDWANQPDPFRRYAGARLFSLPLLPAPDGPTYDALYAPGRIEPQPVSRAALSRLLEYALSITAWKQAGDARWALRSNPSSGNLHPTEGYVLVGPVDGLAEHPALYHYAPKEHGLELRASIPKELWECLMKAFPPQAFLLGMTSVHWREAWKYGERAFRYCQHDVGHAIGSARLGAAALGWEMTLLAGVSSAQLGCLLGVSRPQDCEGAERESPECLAVVWPGQSRGAIGSNELPLALDREAVRAMDGIQWYGRANRLSPDEPLHWDIIDEVAEATVRMERRDVRRRRTTGSVRIEAGEERQATAYQIIHQRRSAVALDGTTPISSRQLFGMLARLGCLTDRDDDAPAPPWDVGFRPPRVHLILFVHLVTGLTPGLYCLARNPRTLPLLRENMNPRFVWTTPPDCPTDLPLFCLEEGDGRRLAAQVSCHQDIAGAGAFSLGMLAEFESRLREEGPSLYPELFWECGLIGQVLYLEAEAAGVRATGIGCFFDDPVHELLGLKDRSFQSLYHFTVGGPVEDQRLTTLPPYPERGEPG